MKKIKQLNMHLDAEFLTDFKKKCHDNGKTMREVIINFIEWYIKEGK